MGNTFDVSVFILVIVFHVSVWFLRRRNKGTDDTIEKLLFVSIGELHVMS